MIPKILNNFNLYADGISYLGAVEELELPKLANKTEDIQPAGFLAPIEVHFGLEKLEMNFTLLEFDSSIIAKFGLTSPDAILLRFLGSASGGSVEQAIEIETRGRIRTLEGGNVKTAEASKLKVELGLTYYKYISDGENLIEIDLLNYIYKVDGVDRFEQKRKNLAI